MKLQNNKGFSLLEILIYTGLIAMVGTLLSGILISVTQLGNQQSASTEVNQQLNFVLQTVQRLVRDSSLVDIPSGTATSSLVLKMKSASEDPTRIYFSGNKIYLQQGTGGTPSPLINDQVLANNITFVKISAYPGHDSVQVDLTLSYNTQNPQESFTKSLSSAVARVSAATFDSSVIPGITNDYDIGLSATRWKNLYLSGSLNVAGAAAVTGDANIEGNVGIGAGGVPAAKLHINTAAGTTAFKVGSTTTQFIINSSGNVGIGTTSPSQLLSVAGTIYSSTGYRFPDGTTQVTASLAAGGQINYQVFTASNSWTRLSGVNTIELYIIGGGGGGGGSTSGGGGNGGGGAGGYVHTFVDVTGISVGSTVTVTIGNGGAGGIGANGSAGNNSSFVAGVQTITAYGGGGGGTGNSTSVTSGDNGGSGGGAGGYSQTNVGYLFGGGGGGVSTPGLSQGASANGGTGSQGARGGRSGSGAADGYGGEGGLGIFIPYLRMIGGGGNGNNVTSNNGFGGGIGGSSGEGGNATANTGGGGGGGTFGYNGGNGGSGAAVIRW